MADLLCPEEVDPRHREKNQGPRQESSELRVERRPHQLLPRQRPASYGFPKRPMATCWTHTASPPPLSRTPTGSRTSSRCTSIAPANKVGPWPASLGCTPNSYSSINPSSANASGSFTPAKDFTRDRLGVWPAGLGDRRRLSAAREPVQDHPLGSAYAEAEPTPST